MIKALLAASDKEANTNSKTIMAGLSYEDLFRLMMSKEAITIDLKEFGVPNVNVLIFGSPSDELTIQKLKEIGKGTNTPVFQMKTDKN